MLRRPLAHLSHHSLALLLITTLLCLTLIFLWWVDYHQWPRKVLRGANVNRALSEKDIEDFAALGGNVIRASFAFQPLIHKEEPYGINQEAIAYLDWLITQCEKYHIQIIIDPHTAPGFQFTSTTQANDVFWQDFSWHQHLIELWAFLAQRYAHKGHVIAGYDLLNEPKLPNNGAANTPADYNLLIRKIVHAIRQHDTKHWIIIEPPLIPTPPDYSYPAITENTFARGFDYLEAPPDKKAAYSPHMYWPWVFTQQGLYGKQMPVPYPGKINDLVFDKAALQNYLQPAVAYAEKYQVPILIGEFGAIRWLDQDGNRYLKDLLDIYETNHWSWTYHSYRSSEMWSAELSNTDSQDRQTKLSTPRLELLKSYFERNSE